MAIPVTQPSVSGEKFPFASAIIVAIAVLFGAILVAVFLKPKIPPSAELLDRLLPKGAGIRNIETIKLDIDGVVSHPTFQTLREIGPVPIIVPQTGKPNPFY